MDRTTGTFQGPREVELFYQVWQTDEYPKAVVIILHGVGEHSGRYLNLVVPLTESGYAVYGYDHLGCGHSPGQRGHIHSWDDFRSGLRGMLQLARTSYPDLPVYLFGHSMGALILLDYVQNANLHANGAIFSGTPIEPAGVGTPAKEFIAKLLSNIWPSFQVNLGLDPASLSRDPQVIQAYRDDPLVQPFVTARWGAEAMSINKSTANKPGSVQMPVLFIHGSQDPLNLLSGVQRFFEQIPFDDKQILTYEGSLHEPHNDLEHNRVAEDLVSWLDAHLPVQEVS